MDGFMPRYVPQLVAGLSLVLVIVNGGLAIANRTMQTEVNARAQYINQSLQLGRLEQGIVRAAASAAVTNKDTKLGDLLTSNGIRYQAAPAPTAAEAASTTSSPAASTAAEKRTEPAAAETRGRSR
jgi:hypothetical protein